MDNCLPREYELSFPGQPEKYTIISVIGRGASTVAYSARNELGAECILKEYYPHNLAIERTASGELRCSEKDLVRFEQGKQNFAIAGNTQHKIRNKTGLQNSTPPSRSVLKANSTLYLDVVSFAGMTFDRLCDEPLITRIKLCLAVAEMVVQYHKYGYLCLDLKPDNIFVQTKPGGKEAVTDFVLYIDFDSVRKKDELSFGRSISFTELWSAPEQLNPYSYKKICEATDIYTLGELIFWSVFGCHSDESEHRDYSVYPFDNVANVETKRALSRTVVQNILTELFHSTLRSSVRNRYQSVDELIPLLKALAVELGKKDFIVEPAIRPKDFFVGRANELKQIDDALRERDIVFVSGIAGIGKSELVKQYICAHKNEYDNILYWTYEGNLDNTVACERTVRVSGVLRMTEETDYQYATRMLAKIGKLTSDQNNLIIIDNLDCLIEDISSKEVWGQIRALHGKIIITTRMAETLYKTVSINALTNTDDLIHLFSEYCPFPDGELESVRGIIDSVEAHTLLVELLAHHTTATHATPSQTLEKMLSSGIGSLSNESVRLLKDGESLSYSVYAHVQKIFSMESISDEQAIILAMLAFLPADGVSTNKLAAFYSIENFESLNCLIRHGWISSITGKDEILKIHPTIATVIAEFVRTNTPLQECFFAKSYEAIRIRKSKEISEAEHVALADAIALSTTDRYAIKSRSAAIFIEQYVGMYSKYGNAGQKLAQIIFAIDTLEATTPGNKYSAILENGYFNKANLLWTLRKYDHSIRICEEHLIKSKESKDIYFTARWYMMLSRICNGYQPEDKVFSKQLKYYFAGIRYSLILAGDIDRKKPRFLSTHNLTENLDYGYLERGKQLFAKNLLISMASWIESQSSIVLFCSKGTKSEISNLGKAIDLREKADKRDEHLRNSSNSYEITIDKARIAFLSCQYHKAKELLQELTVFSSEKELVSTHAAYRVHQFLAQIALRQEPPDYHEAISEFKTCLEIAEDLLSHNTCMVRLELGYIYVLNMELDNENKLNMDLWHETRLFAPEIRKTYYADALRNMGYLYYAQGNDFVARNMLHRAIDEYKMAIAPPELVSFGRARTYMILAKCYFSPNCDQTELSLKNAMVCFNNAKYFYESSVGLEHPEAVACLEQLKFFDPNPQL